MNIKEILAKISKGLKISADELAFLKGNAEYLSKDENEAVADAEVEETPDADADEEDTDEDADVDEKALQSVISKEINKAVSKAVGNLNTKSEDEDEDDDDAVANKVKAHTVVNKTAKQKKNDAETRDFVKALLNKDFASLKAMSTSTTDSAKAGFTIPEALETEIVRLVEDQYGLARQEMRYLPMSGAGNSRKITTGGALSVFWTDEAGSKTSTQPTLARATQELKKLAAIVPMTDELIEDSAVNLTTYVAELFAEAIAKEEDAQFFAGDGTVWTGVVNDANVNTVALGTDETFASDITPAKLRAVLTATPLASRKNGKWHMNTGAFDIIAELKDGNGAYIYPALQNGSSTRLMGKEVVLNDSLNDGSSTTAEAPILFFGDLKKCAVYGDKGGMKIKISDEATIRNVADDGDINLFEDDMTAVRVVKRTGYVLALPTGITVLENGVSS